MSQKSVRNTLLKNTAATKAVAKPHPSRSLPKSLRSPGVQPSATPIDPTPNAITLPAESVAEPTNFPKALNLENRADLNLGARALRDRWPIPAELRSAILSKAIHLCGLVEETSDQPSGSVSPSAAARPLKPRLQIAALRVIAMFDRLSIEQHKIELRAESSRTSAESYFRSQNIDPKTAANALKAINESSTNPRPS